MYQEAEWQDVRAQSQKRLAVLSALGFIGLGLTGWAFAQRRQLLCMAALVLTLCAVIFLYDLTVSPLRRYARLVDQLLHGRTHEETLTYSGMGEELAMVEGVPCRVVLCASQDEAGHRYEHSFYLDAEKELPPFAPGERITLRCHEKVIAEWRNAD